jgi:uncharacterized ferredoxin-like protein
MTQSEIFLDAVRHVAKLCAVSAMTAPKSGGQLFLKGGTAFIETVIIDDRATLKRMADWLRERGNKHREAIWFRDADTAEKLDLVLFVGLAKWYPPQYDCGACGFGTCAEFMQARPAHQTEASKDWEFAGPVCQIRAIDLGIAVGSAAKTASINNVDTRCQTRLAAAARHLGIIESDLAVALSMSVTHKNIFFDKKMPEVQFPQPTAPVPNPTS